MSVDHRRLDVIVAQKFLDGSNVVAALEQVRSEGMAECMTAHVFDDSGFADRFFHGPLKDGLVNMVTSFLANLCVFPTVLLWKHPLPSPVRGRIRVFAVEGIGHLGAAPALGKILFMDGLNLLEVFAKRLR